MGIKEIQELKANAGMPKQKNPYRIPKVSEKKKRQLEANRAAGGENEQKEKWFAKIRKRLTGYCGCGCGRPSSKFDDSNFRSSCCHIFPKANFGSVKYHKDNFVERAFWGGCHTNMDEGGLDKWPVANDWRLIVERFHVLAPLLTDEERATKFYQKLESLIYKYPVNE